MTDEDAIARVFRAEHGRAVAVLARSFGDLDVAEESVQEAFVAAVQHWPTDGLPASPAGWIITTARRKAIDRLHDRFEDLGGGHRAVGFHHAQQVVAHGVLLGVRHRPCAGCSPLIRRPSSRIDSQEGT